MRDDYTVIIRQSSLFWAAVSSSPMETDADCFTLFIQLFFVRPRDLPLECPGSQSCRMSGAW
ncbi:hypothetical protein DPMN_141641 [Dreissena polymorpha]|uniref:Uncharacterized protein n=1 Tax=Dreissena polymorpha TaxID=45954 RepID=A0A9D4G9V1_DREPO|nr:hypothetical protein DPMN_141641 [Dreissena polymorpha]